MSDTTATDTLPLAPGPFDARPESLLDYRCPEWFRDAKFGIWSHWGPQSVPGQGDWYARQLYVPGHKDYNHHLKTFGHPSKSGFKDILPLWKAERWDPVALMDLYVAAGAKYFVSMGVHHDNFDLWNSRHHPWNAAEIGPKRDIVAEWKRAAESRGLRFGVSEHLGASYAWYQASHGADTSGPLAGVPYDGADPEFETYYHPAVPPYHQHVASEWYTEDAVCQHNWYRRIQDLLDNYAPDFLYTDGGIPFGQIGRRLIAHYYNTNLACHGGSLEAVYTYKDIGSGEFFAGAGVQDVERGGIPDISPLPWQTDTSIGDWFYSEQDTFKTTAQIIHTLADVVSKNGNLLLNVVQRPDGSLPDECVTFLSEMADWMCVHGEAIHGTRPWKVFGEGPTQPECGHFKESANYTPDDLRFTVSKDGRTLYAIVLGIPGDDTRIAALGGKADVVEVDLLGSTDPILWEQDDTGLLIQKPSTENSRHAIVFRIRLQG